MYYRRLTGKEQMGLDMASLLDLSVSGPVGGGEHGLVDQSRRCSLASQPIPDEAHHRRRAFHCMLLWFLLRCLMVSAHHSQHLYSLRLAPTWVMHGSRHAQ